MAFTFSVARVAPWAHPAVGSTVDVDPGSLAGVDRLRAEDGRAHSSVPRGPSWCRCGIARRTARLRTPRRSALPSSMRYPQRPRTGLSRDPSWCRCGCRPGTFCCRCAGTWRHGKGGSGQQSPLERRRRRARVAGRDGSSRRGADKASVHQDCAESCVPAAWYFHLAPLPRSPVLGNHRMRLVRGPWLS